MNISSAARRAGRIAWSGTYGKFQSGPPSMGGTYGGGRGGKLLMDVGYSRSGLGKASRSSGAECAWNVET